MAQWSNTLISERGGGPHSDVKRGRQGIRDGEAVTRYHRTFNMSQLRTEYSPVSQATTNSIQVEVIAQYSPENSRPNQLEWVFQYTVRITNQGTDTVQLINRHWVIVDALEHVEEVRGPGVIGNQPILEPGQSFKYSSWCPLKTQTGTMYGEYEMLGPNGSRFDVEIAPFGLRARYTVH